MAQHSEDFLRLANAAKQRITEVSPEEAKALIESGAIVLDVRDKDEFEAGHIDEATHLSRGTLEMLVAEVVPDKSTRIICYCAGGNRGALAADTLQNLGYENVSSIQGGLRAYVSAEKKP
jgi:rhodanese-related sulfurtransferase